MTDANTTEKTLADKLREGVVLGNGYVVKAYCSRYVDLFYLGDDYSTEVEKISLTKEALEKLSKIFYYLDAVKDANNADHKKSHAERIERHFYDMLNSKEANDVF